MVNPIKQCTLVNYDSSVVLTRKLLIIRLLAVIYEIKMFTRLATALTLKLKVQGSNFALKMKVFS